MKLWTIQHKEALIVAKNQGYLTGDPNFIESEYFRPKYDWMISQLKERVPHFSGDYPIWAYSYKPDFRTYGFRNGEKLDLVLVTCDVPIERCIPSNFDMWHYVLNNWLIVSSQEEFDNEPKYVPQRVLKKSWIRIFDMTPSSNEWHGNFKASPKELQYCCDRIFLKEIISVRDLSSLKGYSF